MKIIISPAKKMSGIPKKAIQGNNNLLFPQETQELLGIMQQKSVADLCRIMDISKALGELNHERYINFPWPILNGSPAIYAFEGDVYAAMKVEKFSSHAIAFATANLFILSGLYGLLRANDLIMPYRLEMGIRLENPHGKDLYHFWGDKITDMINQYEDGLLVNLASNEYFSAVRPNKLKAKLLNIIFKEKKGDEYQIIGIHAKKARGMMASYICENQIQKAEEIKEFSAAKYGFSPQMSDENHYIFVR